MKEIKERYILRKNIIDETYSIITEYYINMKWVEVHNEKVFSDQIKIGGSISSFLSNCQYVDVIKNETYIDMIYIKKSKIFSRTSTFDPVYNRHTEVHFFVPEYNGHDEIFDSSQYDNELMNSLYKINGCEMYFNLNWDFTNKLITPLKKIHSLLNKKMDVEIVSYTSSNQVMYKIKLIGFRFEEICDLKNYDWMDGGIKNLVVIYSFDEEKIII